MKRLLLLTILGLALSVIGWSTGSPAAAQDRKMARGTLTAMVADSVTVTVQGKEMKFSVDAKTVVEAAGAGTKTRAEQKKGAPGPKLADVLKTGQAVEVTYSEAGGTNRASRIRAVLSVGAGGGSTSQKQPAGKTATGTVKSVSAGSLTVSAGGKDMTFSVDTKTVVAGTGAGTKTAAAGGKTVMTDLVTVGDTVSVSYGETGTTMHAERVRVTIKRTVTK